MESVSATQPDVPQQDNKTSEHKDPNSTTVATSKDHNVSSPMKSQTVSLQEVKQRLSHMQVLSCQLLSDMQNKMNKVKKNSALHMLNLNRLYENCHQLLKEEEEKRLANIRRVENEAKHELEEKLLNLVHFVESLKETKTKDQSLSHFDHQEDVETQVTQDVFSMQREAWELFEQFERKFCSVHSTATLYRERIVESFQQLHQNLLKKEEVQLAKIAEKKQKAIKDFQIRESLISGLCSSITQLLFLLENEEATFLDTELLKRFRAELEDLSKCEVALHGHVSPIHTQVWRGIRHFVKPLQRSLQFDPQSAHTNLAVSKNLKQVRFSPFAQPLKSPNSFDPGLYVLGVPGFHSGQHYWEVDVGHKSNWIVGVVKESVPRKGSQNLDPANGFWVLNKQGDKVYVGCGLSCPKSLRSPQRIGLFIDILDGYLAFYDVDTNSLIFEITGCHFVGNLLPFFCPGVPAKEEDLGPLTLLN